MSLTKAGHCNFLQPGKLVAHFMPRVSCSDDFLILCSAREWSHHLLSYFSSLTSSGERKPSLPPWSIRSLENCSLKGQEKKPSSHEQRLAASVLSLCVSWARNGLKPSGQQQKQRSWTSFHANDLSVASCSFTVLLSARAPGPSKPGARF